MKERTSRTKPIGLLAPVLVGVLFVFGCAGDAGQASSAADPPLIDSEPIALGELQYTLNCASCHGESGRGDGPVAEALTTPPSNLRMLRADNGGVFPTEAVVSFIDGREEVRAHGTRQMPVWGNIWGEVGGQPVPEEEVQRRISELVEYLRSIQE